MSRGALRLLLFLLPISAIGYAQIGLAALLCATFLAPVAIGPALRLREVKVIIALAVIAAVTVPVIYAHSVAAGRSITGRPAFHEMVELLTAAVSVAVIAATRRRGLSARAVAGWFSAGLLAQQLLNHSEWKDNPWKYAFAVPVALVLLALAPPDRRWLQYAALVFLAGISAAQDYRSFTGFCLAAAVLMAVFGSTKREGKPLRRLAAGVVAGFVAYQVIAWASLHGLLGANTQARSLAQTAEGQTLISGARPEWHAAVHLFASNPLGYGPGLVPNADDVFGAVSTLGPTADNSGYVTQYLFGNGIELHSVVSDMWCKFGLLGLALAVYLGVLVVRWFARTIARKEPKPTALELLLPLIAAWDLLFSPMSALPRIALAVGLALSARLGAVEVLERPDP